MKLTKKELKKKIENAKKPVQQPMYDIEIPDNIRINKPSIPKEYSFVFKSKELIVELGLEKENVSINYSNYIYRGKRKKEKRSQFDLKWEENPPFPILSIIWYPKGYFYQDTNLFITVHACKKEYRPILNEFLKRETIAAIKNWVSNTIKTAQTKAKLVLEYDQLSFVGHLHESGIELTANQNIILKRKLNLTEELEKSKEPKDGNE